MSQRVSDVFIKSFEQDLDRRMGINIEKPEANKSATQLEKAQKFMEGVTDAAGQIMSSIGEMQGLRTRVTHDQVSEPQFNPIPEAVRSTPLQIPQVSVEKTPFLRYIEEQRSSPELEQNPNDDILYVDKEGNQLDPATVEHLLKRKQPEIRNVEQD